MPVAPRPGGQAMGTSPHATKDLGLKRRACIAYICKKLKRQVAHEEVLETAEGVTVLSKWPSATVLF